MDAHSLLSETMGRAKKWPMWSRGRTITNLDGLPAGLHYIVGRPLIYYLSLTKGHSYKDR